jgi:hypothetical protein
MRGLLVSVPERGGGHMDNARDTGIVALALVLLVCLTIFFLQVAQPTGSSSTSCSLASESDNAKWRMRPVDERPVTKENERC